MRKSITLVLVVVLILGILSGCGKKDTNVSADSSENKNVVTVEIAEPVKRDISVTHVLSGKLSANEDVLIIPEVSVPSKVKKIEVQLGDKVSKGQVLFTLDDENVRKQYDQAKAAYDIAKANYEKTKEQIENAKINFERTKKLYEEGAVSKQAFEQAQLSASDSTIALLEAQLSQAKVSLDQAYSQLQDTVIKSPINGSVAAINIKENEFASNSQPAMRVVNIDKLTVNVGVTEELINKIQQGQEVQVVVRAAMDDSIKGIIKGVSPVPDLKTQLYPVEIEIKNSNDLLKGGMFAEIAFTTEKRENVLAVPSDVIINKNNKNYVYVVKNNIASLKEVKVGLDNGKYVEVISGLNEEDKIIVKGHDYVEDGIQVKEARGEN